VRQVTRVERRPTRDPVTRAYPPETQNIPDELSRVEEDEFPGYG
jgi:hypothetical protein